MRQCGPAPQSFSAEVERRKRHFSAGAGCCERPLFPPESAEVECGAPAGASFGFAAIFRRGWLQRTAFFGQAGRCEQAPFPPESAEVECGMRPEPLPAPEPLSDKVECSKRSFFHRGRTLQAAPVSAGFRRSRMRPGCRPAAPLPHAGSGLPALAGVGAAAPARPKPQAPPMVQVMASLGVHSS